MECPMCGCYGADGEFVPDELTADGVTVSVHMRGPVRWSTLDNRVVVHRVHGLWCATLRALDGVRVVAHVRGHNNPQLALNALADASGQAWPGVPATDNDPALATPSMYSTLLPEGQHWVCWQCGPHAPADVNGYCARCGYQCTPEALDSVRGPATTSGAPSPADDPDTLTVRGVLLRKQPPGVLGGRWYRTPNGGYVTAHHLKYLEERVWCAGFYVTASAPSAAAQVDLGNAQPTLLGTLEALAIMAGEKWK